LVGQLLILSVGLAGQGVGSGVVGVGHHSVFGVGGTLQECGNRGSAAGIVVEGAGLRVGATRHANHGEMIQDVVV
jgi:hypothetical protein